MKKTEIKYGIIDIPEGTILCKIEKGGDKDGTARYRFVDTGKKTNKRSIALISNETIMLDLYDAMWARTPNGFVKAQDKITWYASYKEASNAYASLTNRKRKILITILVLALVAGTIFLAYKFYKAKKTTYNTTINTDISNEIQLD